jgi:endonuclease/exonuclease/phosphatase (EEP) superfamily protein YafD
MVLTSRNEPLVLRRALAEPFPDLLKSGGGGCNAILVRSQRITAHRTLRLRWLPERRCAHGVLLGDGTWIVNTHGEASRRELAREDLDAVAGAADRWAGDAPRILLGGDLNLTGRPAAPGYAHLAGHHVDHLLARGLAATGPGELLPAGGLSDHRPLLLDTYPRAP